MQLSVSEAIEFGQFSRSGASCGTPNSLSGEADALYQVRQEAGKLPNNA